jgi:hypothetical protein
MTFHGIDGLNEAAWWRWRLRSDLFGQMLNGGVEMIFGPAITNSRSSDNLPVADCAVL